MGLPVMGIEATYLMNNILIALQFRYKLVLELLIHPWLVVLIWLVECFPDLLHSNPSNMEN